MLRNMKIKHLTQLMMIAAAFVLCVAYSHADAPRRWNILWISVEDISADLGCYGSEYAVTPTLDRFAAEGVRYTNCYGHAGVCAINRTGMITAMYPTSIGTQHMRCSGVPPVGVKCFPEYLRAAGYFTTNQSKTDYNFAPPVTAWDIQGGNKAHWRSREDKSQPFFCVINLTTTHESQIRKPENQYQQRIKDFKSHEIHDPAKAKLPPYYPDTPAARQDWARYHDNITFMDKQVAVILKQLEEDGLVDSTVVVFWSDHGRGLPRGKRWLYDSGLHVPLIIRWPGKLNAGTVDDRMVALMDLGPTMLSIAGVEPPKHMHGKPFLGQFESEPRQYVYGARDRMDETYDLIRAVRDKRYKYLRNYLPLRSRGQHIQYMDLMPTMRDMRRLNDEGRLDTVALRQYFEPTKPLEELYDTEVDPHEVNNLADDPAYAAILSRLRKAHVEWIVRTGDLGLIPEATVWEKKRPGGQMAVTEQPDVSVESANSQQRISLKSQTPGASIAYSVNNGRWLLYTEPVILKPGEVLKTKACRLGYKDSNVVRHKHEPSG